MESSEKRNLFDRVRTNAFRDLAETWEKLQTTNLYLDEHIYETREMIGPKRQNIFAERPSILVFADDKPLANYSHECRYLLYDAQSGDLHKEVQAQFPPFNKERPGTLKAFHEPVQVIDNPNLYRVKPILRCPIIIPDCHRYAIL